MAITAKSFTFLLISSLFLVSCFCTKKTQNTFPIENGLSWTFYDYRCPKAESIIRKQLKKVFKNDIGQAAGLLRLHFHDCFVQGCDGSVLLDGSASGPSEQDAIPNLTLRAKAFEIIDDLRERVHKECGRVVSCADIVAIAARDSVYLSGGPEYDVPLGRRDGLNFATQEATLANLPPPTDNASAILRALAAKNLDATDVVALSGGHTIENSTNTAVLDIRSPNKFDNKYYVNLVKRQGLFTSDQDLYSYKKTRGIVTSFAEDESLFFEKFVVAMIKMSQLSVLTGNSGEIRANCSVRNSDNSYLVSEVEEDLETKSELR
ncbi:hypothetical protein OIU84_005515 [Salix udensis]|uniref:Peroxidase n=1 Tax=Salix udensis TaxID=889485 RepID=A0AAD6JWA6_9ROSI|nr:hypothetical protein OIU84_005515 [Salix udensis]